MKKVCIILLNWNNWPDTLECLESLFRLDYPRFSVVVCDNASTDGSVERIRAWAAGELDVLTESPSPPASGSRCPKPLALVEFGPSVVGEGFPGTGPESRLVLLHTGGNLGFAGGNNVGLRLALNCPENDYFWVLNNDTVVAPDALRALVDRMSLAPEAGLCGSTLLEYRRPDRINALGGALYSRWIGLAWHLGRGRTWPAKVPPKRIEARMDYVVGAAMFASRDFLQGVGLMEESYFLYYEELDWALRARNRFALAWAPASVVYHKVGGTIGTSSHPARKSWTCDFYTLRNRIRFTRQHCPYALPSVYLGLAVALLVRLLCGKWRRAAMIARLMVDPDTQLADCCPG